MNESKKSQTGQAWVVRWCDFYTRGLPVAVASARHEELAADLHDHTEWAEAEGATARATRRAVTWRALKGAPADLAWRHAQLRAGDTTSFGTRFFHGWLLFGVTVVGFGLVVLALTAVIRDGPGILKGDAAVMPTFVAALAITCGLVLLARKRTRPLGALWIAAGSPVVATMGIGLLAQNTTLLFYASRATPSWGAGQLAIAICLVVLNVAASVWWMPELKKSRPR